ncbi:MAG: YlqD family protein [Veillonellaceae bacterium]|nr:YlqD family protein [Veillonellaceae bacterium]
MEQMKLRVPVVVKAKVTEDLKTKLIADVQQQLDLVNQDLQQIEFQAKRLLTEQAKIDAQGLLQVRQQIENNRSQRLQYKDELEQRMKETQELEVGVEIVRGTMDQMIDVKVGDDLDSLMNAEILLEDGKIVAFRK